MFNWLTGKKKHLSADVASVSEQGLVRRENQDSLFMDPSGAVYCVADGMGGGEGGEIASKIVCEHFGKIASGSASFAETIKRTGEAIAAANAEICEYAAKRNWRQMGSTVAALLVDVNDGGTAVICHVGDSRIFRLRDGMLEQLTHDHTIGGEISRRQGLKNFKDELALRFGALSHVLTRAVGIEPNATPDWRKLDIRDGDVYMICSDGVYNMVDNDGIRRCLQLPGPAADAVARLSEAVMDGGATDNFTCIVVKFS